MNIFQQINPANPPESLADADVFVLLRERILQYGLIGVSAIATILVPMVVIRDIAANNWALVIIYSLAYLVVLSMTYFRNIPYSIRSNVFTGLFFLIGVVDLLGAGMSGEGRLFLMAFVIMTAILATERSVLRSIITGISSVILLTIIGRGMSSGWITAPPVEALTNSYRFGDWINGNIVFLMVTTAVISSLLLLIARAQQALSKQEEFSEEIENERLKLQAEFDQQKLEVDRRATELETASALARDISRFTNLDNLLANAVDLIRDQFGFYHAGLFLYWMKTRNSPFSVLQPVMPAAKCWPTTTAFAWVKSALLATLLAKANPVSLRMFFKTHFTTETPSCLIPAQKSPCRCELPVI